MKPKYPKNTFVSMGIINGQELLYYNGYVYLIPIKKNQKKDRKK